MSKTENYTHEIACDECNSHEFIRFSDWMNNGDEYILCSCADCGEEIAKVVLPR